MLGKLTKLLIHMFLCPVLSAAVAVFLEPNGTSCKRACLCGRSVYVVPFISPVSEIQGVISAGLADCILLRALSGQG